MATWLTDDEYRTVVAMCERLIPADDTPGATDAGVADYIDGLLGAFSFDPPRVWAGGPSSGRFGGTAGFSRFHPLTALDELAWRTRIEGSLGRPEREFNGPVVGLQERYRAGLAALGPDFCHCDPEEQIRRLRAERDFTGLVYEHACEGMYGAPEYGGNRDGVGWSNIGYAGDVQPRVERRGGVGPVTVDAVIVGSGPGGATVADVLTAAGWSVVILEKGRNHLIDLDDPSRLLEDFSNDEIKFIDRYFLGPDPFLEPRTFRIAPDDGDHSFVGEVNSIPSTVGGGGTHADGKVPRFLEEDFAMLSSYGPQEGASVDDWPLDYAELEPYYADVERRIGVSGLAGANPFAAWRSGPYPMPPGPSMYGATLSAAAAESLGFHPYPAPGATNSEIYDGRPACNNCGFCAYFACPIHAKGDPVAMLQRALLSGNAELRPETFVSRIRTDGRRATGVDFIGPDGVERSMDARHVVVAGGAVETPRLLLLSGFGHPLIGRHLMTHFQTIVVGSFAGYRFHGERGRAVTEMHDDGLIQDDGSRAAAKSGGLPWVKGGMVEHGGPALPIMEAKIYRWGRSHKETMRSSPMRERLWAFTMQGEDLPVPTNRIDLDPTVRDVRGFPVARYTYRPHQHELVASAHHGPKLVAILQAMGAEWTSIVTSPGTKGGPGDRTTEHAPMSRHVMGTVRMGNDPETSVVDRMGRLHQYENVLIADSSVFVTSSGYGPTLTLAALAARAAAAMVG